MENEFFRISIEEICISLAKNIAIEAINRRYRRLLSRLVRSTLFPGIRPASASVATEPAFLKLAASPEDMWLPAPTRRW